MNCSSAKANLISRISPAAQYVLALLSLVGHSCQACPTFYLILLIEKNSSMGGGFDDDSKFDSPWRRDGPLPDREAPRGRMDAGERAERTPSASEHVDQWRSSKTRAPVESDAPPFRRRASGFGGADSPSGAADREDSWSMGSKFKPSNNPEDTTTAPVQRINNARRGPEASVGEDSDWRRSRPGNATASR